MKKRLKRAGVDNVIMHVLNSESDPFLKRHLDSADWVLVDAPCSGSGTWRRNPDLKWRFEAKDMDEMRALQRSILANAARLVAPGGALVYATCSLFSQENELQIAEFLSERPDFKCESLGEKWDKLATHKEGIGEVIRLSPHKHETDGFFVARLRRL